MRVVRRIFAMVRVEGRSIRAVRRALGAEGLPTPGGRRHWSQMTVRAMILDDVYRPHTREELEALVPAQGVREARPRGALRRLLAQHAQEHLHADGRYRAQW
jgi:hypothetical protein